jgi:hypothetical protein
MVTISMTAGIRVDRELPSVSQCEQLPLDWLQGFQSNSPLCRALQPAISTKPRRVNHFSGTHLGMLLEDLPIGKDSNRYSFRSFTSAQAYTVDRRLTARGFPTFNFAAEPLKRVSLPRWIFLPPFRVLLSPAGNPASMRFSDLDFASFSFTCESR